MTATRTTLTPPIDLTVRGIYICFDQDDDGNFSGQYEDTVYYLETVKNLHQQDEITSTQVRASGKVYKTVDQMTGSVIETTQVAWPDDLLARMRGDILEGGLVFSGDARVRPYFAVGYESKNSDGSEFVWNPKCKLQEDDRELSTSEKNYSERSRSLKFYAEAYNSRMDITVKAPTNGTHGYTEETFFAAPVLVAPARP